MKVQAFGLTDVGKKRTKNEDSFLINESVGLFIVADGMGGHSGGEFASRFAVTTIEEVIQSLKNDPEATVISGVNSADSQFGDRLRYAIQMASQKIFDQALFDQGLKGMGTTVASLFVENKKACVANVGDSRVYLVRDGEIKQLTQDHSLVSEQMRAGLISEKDAQNHQFKNVITRSVGYQEEVEIDLSYIDLQAQDKLVLCTDGLTNKLSDKEIFEMVQNHDRETSARELIRLANEKGGEDNITVLVCDAPIFDEDSSEDWVVK